jgi:hypothetical protein
VGIAVAVLLGAGVNVAQVPPSQVAPEIVSHDPHPLPDSMKQPPPQSQQETGVAVVVVVAVAVGVTVGVSVWQLKLHTAFGTAVQEVPQSEPVA